MGASKDTVYNVVTWLVSMLGVVMIVKSDNTNIELLGVLLFSSHLIFYRYPREPK